MVDQQGRSSVASLLDLEHAAVCGCAHERTGGGEQLEPRVPEAVRDELTRRGHDLEIAGDWTEGYLLAAERNPDSGVLEAGCDPRGGKSEVFPAFALCW